MAERILTLLNNDELCTRFGLTAQQNSRIFSSERMLDQIEALYRALLATP
jgi:glycosyltransferase involved in cell wall biosynthesis